MICNKCGTANRDGASFCDSCGEPLVPDDQPRSDSADADHLEDGAATDGRLLDSGGLAGWMAADWTLHFIGAAVVGFLLGFAMIALDYYAYSIFFFLIGLVGILGTRHMLRAKA